MTPPSRLLRHLAPARLNAQCHRITAQLQLLPDAEPGVIAAFIANIVGALAPVGPIEAELARRIAIAHWCLNRIHAMEDRLFAV